MRYKFIRTNYEPSIQERPHNLSVVIYSCLSSDQIKQDLKKDRCEALLIVFSKNDCLRGVSKQRSPPRSRTARTASLEIGGVAGMWEVLHNARTKNEL